MTRFADQVRRRLPHARCPTELSIDCDLIHEIYTVLDIFSSWAVPGAAWNARLVEAAAVELLRVRDRDMDAYAFARAELLAMASDLDRCPDMPLPSHLPRDVDPVAILRGAVAVYEPTAPFPKRRSARAVLTLMTDPNATTT